MELNLIYSVLGRSFCLWRIFHFEFCVPHWKVNWQFLECQQKKVVSHVAAHHTSHIYNMHVCCYVLIAIYHFNAFLVATSLRIQIYAFECMEKRITKIFHFSIPNAFHSRVVKCNQQVSIISMRTFLCVLHATWGF